ncbi:hypothetical protein V5799_015755 [Amblyomma americanum]|uniref:Uncharacterized protein n=1 Tax=Amblyomma americanum TaxID=6943 RepID=A0AAQ4F6Y2_AMBAM
MARRSRCTPPDLRANFVKLAPTVWITHTDAVGRIKADLLALAEPLLRTIQARTHRHNAHRTSCITGPVPMWLLLFPSLADNSFYTWQHGSSTISDIGDAYKNKPGTTHLGHDTVIAMEILPLQILQLSATKHRGHWVSYAVACATLLAPFVSSHT